MLSCQLNIKAMGSEENYKSQQFTGGTWNLKSGLVYPAKVYETEFNSILLNTKN
jgi:hypothetical protein